MLPDEVEVFDSRSRVNSQVSDELREDLCCGVESECGFEHVMSDILRNSCGYSNNSCRNLLFYKEVRQEKCITECV